MVQVILLFDQAPRNLNVHAVQVGDRADHEHPRDQHPTHVIAKKTHGGEQTSGFYLVTQDLPIDKSLLI